jgi:broad specificity phosphatase PhoE
MPRLYFIRHGETDWNRAGRLQGATEVPLNGRGRKQAKAVAAHLKALVSAAGGPELAALPFHASPMQRTCQTIDILREALALEAGGYAIEPRLREISFGIWEGRDWPEIRRRDPIGYRDRDADRWHFAPPGGESYSMVAERLRPFVEGLTQDACIVSHGGVARAMMVIAGGLEPEVALQSDIWQGKVLLFENGACEWLPAPGHG